MDHRLLWHAAIAALVLSGCASIKPVLLDSGRLRADGTDILFVGKPAEVSFHDGTILNGVILHVTTEVAIVQKTGEMVPGEYPIGQIDRITLKTVRSSLPAGIMGAVGGVAIGLAVTDEWKTGGFDGIGRALFLRPLMIIACTAAGALVGMAVGGMAHHAASDPEVYVFSPGSSSPESGKGPERRYVLFRDRFLAEDESSISILWKNSLTRLLKKDIVIEPHPLGYRLVVPARSFGEQ